MPVTGSGGTVLVDRSRCLGHGVCVGLAVGVFDLDDAGLAVVRDALTPDDLLLAVRAERRCPQKAITVNIPSTT
jgi:ferredoxin